MASELMINTVDKLLYEHSVDLDNLILINVVDLIEAVTELQQNSNIKGLSNLNDIQTFNHLLTSAVLELFNRSVLSFNYRNDESKTVYHLNTVMFCKTYQDKREGSDFVGRLNFMVYDKDGADCIPNNGTGKSAIATVLEEPVDQHSKFIVITCPVFGTDFINPEVMQYEDIDTNITIMRCIDMLYQYFGTKYGIAFTGISNTTYSTLTISDLDSIYPADTRIPIMLNYINTYLLPTTKDNLHKQYDEFGYHPSLISKYINTTTVDYIRSIMSEKSNNDSLQDFAKELSKTINNNTANIEDRTMNEPDDTVTKVSDPKTESYFSELDSTTVDELNNILRSIEMKANTINITINVYT